MASTFSFFTNEAVSLEKRVNIKAQPLQTKLENLDSQYEIDRCGKWIESNKFQRVTSENTIIPSLNILF